MTVDGNPPPPAAAPAENSVSDDLIGDSTSWPSLSESTRPPPRSPTAPPSDPPIVAPQEPAISHSPQNHRFHNTNTTSNPNPNWKRSSGRGGSSRASRVGFVRHPPPPQQLPSPPPLPPAFYSGFEGPMRGTFFYGNGFGGHPRPTDHQFSQSLSFHPGGARPRGDSAGRYKHANYRGPDWNAMPQGFQFPQPVPPMGFPPFPLQSLVPITFMHAPVFPPDPFTGMQPYTGGHAPVPPPSLSPPPQVDLNTKLLNQINYYFSDENLVKDMYLRERMDGGGWVHVSLIANFRRVRELTQDIQLILKTLEASAVVEVLGHNIRRRNDWQRWIPSNTVSEAPTAELNTVIRYLQSATLEEAHAADRISSSATNTSSSCREVLI